MATTLRAPWPLYKVTSVLPNPAFEDTRSSESTIVIKRTMTGRKITHPIPSDRYNLVLPFQLTRMKSLELEAFLNAYQSAPIYLELYDGSQWEAKLVGSPLVRSATGRIGANAIVGKELVETTLTFSAKRLN